MTNYSKHGNPVDGNVNEGGMDVPGGPVTQTPTVNANNPKHIQALQKEEKQLRQLYPIKMLPPDNKDWYQMFCERYHVTDDSTVQGTNMERMHKGDLQSRPTWEYTDAKNDNSVKHVSTNALYERQRTLIMNSSKRLQQIIDGTHLISNWDRSQNKDGEISDKPSEGLAMQYHPADAAAYCGVRSEDVNDLVAGKGMVKQRLSELRLRDRQDAHEMQLIARELQERGDEPHPKLTNEEQARYEELQELSPKFSLLVHETDPKRDDHPAGPDDKANKKVVDAAKNNTSSPKMDTSTPPEQSTPVNKDVENNGIEHTTSVVDEQGTGKAAETAARIERDHQPTPAENLEELDQRCQNYLVQNPDAIPGRKLRLRMAAQMGINARTGKPEKPFFSRMRDIKDRMIEVNDHARELKWRDKTAGEKVWTGVRKGGHIAKQLGKGIGITSLVVAFGIAGWVLTKSHKGITNMAATMNNSIINGMVNGLDPHARQLMGNMLDDGPQR